MFLFAKSASFAPIARPALIVAAVLLLAGCNGAQTLQAERQAPPQTTVTSPPPAKPTQPPVATAPGPTPQKWFTPDQRTGAAPPTADAPAGTGIEIQRAPVLTLSGEAAQEPIKVGLLLPLSGAPQTAQLGQELLDAATMALFEIAGQRLELLPRDTSGTPEGAQEAARQAIQEGATLLLGPLFSTSVQAAAPVARERGIPVIAFSSDSSVAGDGVYILSFTPQQEVRRVVGYALSQGLTRFAALAPANGYGRTVVEALRQEVILGGGTLMQTNYYSADGAGADEAVKVLANYDSRRAALLDRRRQLARLDTAEARRQLEALEKVDALGDLPYDAIMLPEGGQTLRSVASLLPYYDIDLNRIRLIGTGRWDEPAIGREPSLVGGWFAGAARNRTASFRQRFHGYYGRVPARIASLAYDATALAAVLAQRDDAPNFSQELLTDENGFAGADGLFRFRANGLAERGLAVLEIRREGFRIVDPAPESFRDLVN